LCVCVFSLWLSLCISQFYSDRFFPCLIFINFLSLHLPYPGSERRKKKRRKSSLKSNDAKRRSSESSRCMNGNVWILCIRRFANLYLSMFSSSLLTHQQQDQGRGCRARQRTTSCTAHILCFPPLMLEDVVPKRPRSRSPDHIRGADPDFYRIKRDRPSFPGII
jgi:hypothetical protein